MDINTSYKTLGIPYGSTVNEIKSAYKSCVKIYHPDRYNESFEKQHAQERLVQINLAYEIICTNLKQHEMEAPKRKIPEQYCEITPQKTAPGKTAIHSAESIKTEQVTDPDDIEIKIQFAKLKANAQISDKIKQVSAINTEATQYKKYIRKKYFQSGYYEISGNKDNYISKLKRLFSNKKSDT